MKWLFIIFILLLVSGGGVFMFSKVRGLRNNNPGNIRHGQAWQGRNPVQTDKSFIQFDSPVYGIRAINKILKTYSTIYGLNTVRGIISRWAPPVNDKGKKENDTESYINSVAGRLGVEPDQIIDVRARAVALSQAIIKHENGLQPYPLLTIETGVARGWA